MGERLGQSQASNLSDPKPIKLRESCDSCLIAKVKCGKQRPLCKRCLTNGSSCIYSPSSKTGRRNQKRTPNKETDQLQEQISTSTQTGSPITSKVALQGAQSLSGTIQNGDLIDTTRNLLGSEGLSYLDLPYGTDHTASNPFSSSELIDPFMPSFDPEKGFDFSATPSSSSASHVTLDFAMRSLEELQQDARTASRQSPLAGIIPTQPPNPTSAPDHRQNESSWCDCFAACVSTLQTLHTHSCLLSPVQNHGGCPSFDVVLSANKDAIEKCAALLDCKKCVSECGKSVVIMMLATVIGKTISLYRAACLLMFGSTNSMQSSAQLAFGTYKVTGENRQLLEIEILLLDLRRVASVLIAYSEQFCKESATKDDESGVYETLKSYLENNLRHVVQYLTAQKTHVTK